MLLLWTLKQLTAALPDTTACFNLNVNCLSSDQCLSYKEISLPKCVDTRGSERKYCLRAGAVFDTIIKVRLKRGIKALARGIRQQTSSVT